MSTNTETPVAADVQATETADTKPTATSAPAADETKEVVKGKEDVSQEDADKQIAEDLKKEDKKRAKDQSDGTMPEEEDEAESEEAEKPKDEENAEENPDEEKADPAKGADARKLALQTEIRELVSKRNELRGEVEQQNAKAYRTETPEELIDQGLSEEEAAVEVMKQEAQMREFNIHVADLNANLNIEALQVMQDFPVFDEDSSEFDEGLRDRVRNLYLQAAKPKIDKKTGLVIENNLPPYEFYKAFADTHQSSGQKSRAEGAVEGKKAADKELAAAETQSSTAPRKKAEDPFLKGLLSTED